MPEQIIHRTEIPGIDLVPDSRHAMKYNNAEPWAAARDLQIGLRDVVEAVRDRYDMVLIDCPPNLHLCSWAALVASDFLIVPLQPEDYGAQGIIDVQESVALVTELANPGLSLLGYLITMFNARKSIHIRKLADLQKKGRTSRQEARKRRIAKLETSQMEPCG